MTHIYVVQILDGHIKPEFISSGSTCTKNTREKMSMKYHLCRVCVVWVLVLIVVAQAHNSRGAAEARAGPVLMTKHQRQFDLWRTLGVGCSCCDGESGQCRSTWEGSCTKLECLPWKLF